MAKKETLRDWFSKNDGTGWVDCKTGKPCGRKKVKNVEVILPVDQQKLNAHQQPRKKLALKELVGKMAELKNQKAMS